MAKLYGLHDLTEARSYWAHLVLGPGPKESVTARTANEIFGSPDDLKSKRSVDRALAHSTGC